MTFTPAQPVITFTDLTGASRSAVTTLSALFRVHPADATCTFRRIWDTTSTPAAMYLNDNSGPDRSLRALVVGIGEVIVDVRCVASGLDATERVVFTALSPDACERPITLGAAAVSGTWTSSCTSTQRGDNQTPYYAKSYTFTLAEAATVTVVVTSDQATNLYVHDGVADSDEPLHEASSSGGQASTATIIKLLNPGGMLGHYTIKVANRADRTPGSFTISVTAVNACPSDQVYMSAVAGGADNGCRPRSCGDGLFRDPGTQRCRESSYRYTAAIIDGVVSAAQGVIRDNTQEPCVTRTTDPVTANELAAHVLAIPIRELQKDNPSLMDLSRWDSLFQRSDNIGLFSRGTQADEVRAHWSPGVGPWQLDLWWPVKTWNHAKRANVNNAAAVVAEHLFNGGAGGLCDGTQQLERRLRTWVACTAQKRFGEDPSRTKECTNPEFWYDITPLPFGFVSFTDTDGKKYVAFPANDIGEAGTGTGYTATFVRGVPADKHARELERDDGYGWFVDWEGTEVLYIEQCSTPGSCRWHRV